LREILELGPLCDCGTEGAASMPERVVHSLSRFPPQHRSHCVQLYRQRQAPTTMLCSRCIRAAIAPTVTPNNLLSQARQLPHRRVAQRLPQYRYVMIVAIIAPFDTALISLQTPHHPPSLTTPSLAFYPPRHTNSRRHAHILPTAPLTTRSIASASPRREARYVQSVTSRAKAEAWLSGTAAE
jgi:hypothetical protein